MWVLVMARVVVGEIRGYLWDMVRWMADKEGRKMVGVLVEERT